MQQFQVTDHIRMKSNLRKIDTYGISPHILKNHRKTIFWVREVHELVGGEGALRIYPTCKIYDKELKEYVEKEIDFYLAYFNPEMFMKVEECENEKISSFKRKFTKCFS